MNTSVKSILFLTIIGLSSVSGQFNWLSGLTATQPPPPPSVAPPPPTPVMAMPDLVKPAVSPQQGQNPSALLESLKLLQNKWIEQQQKSTETVVPEVQQPPPQLDTSVQDALPLDLLCGARWHETKRLLGSVFFDPAVALMTLSNEDVNSILMTAASSLPQDLLSNTSECGLARLMTQLLQLVAKFGETGSSPQMVNEAVLVTEPVHSPIMTVMLDIPWVDTINSGWPYFQLIGQIQMRNWQDPSRPSAPLPRDMILQDESMTQFYSTVMTAIEAQDFNLLVQASSLFLEFAGENAQQHALEKPMAFITAIAGVSIGVSDPVQKASLFDQMQNVMISAIHTPEDLVYVLNTSWPIWSLINLSLMAATGPSNA